MNKEIAQAIEQASEILSAARNCVALTGAGISTASGIPDFRSPKSGLWAKHDPMEVANIHAFRRFPEHFYDWIRPLVKLTAAAVPNPAHLALADLEKHGPLKAIITQNIDGLHTRAGSQIVHEVHGHTREVRCLDCGIIDEAEPKLNDLVEKGKMPTCSYCGGTVKPEVILFGELLPAAIMRSAEVSVTACDTFIVAGSSLEVAPVNHFPIRAKQLGAKLIIINFQQTDVDGIADVVIPADVTQVLPALADPFVQDAIS